MESYLKNTEYASTTLFDALNIGKHKLSNLNAELLSKKSELEQLQYKFSETPNHTQELNIPELETDVIDLENSILSMEIPFNNIGVSILQVAIQGILKTFGSIENCSDGRKLGSQSLKNVIYHATDQSTQYKKGDYNKDVIECFSNLKNDFGIDFNLNINQNLSTTVIHKILRWNTYSDYYHDMVSFHLVKNLNKAF